MERNVRFTIGQMIGALLALDLVAATAAILVSVVIESAGLLIAAAYVGIMANGAALLLVLLPIIRVRQQYVEHSAEGDPLVPKFLRSPVREIHDFVASVKAVQMRNEMVAQENTVREQEQSLFFANATHELRTPIQTLQGFLDLLSEGAAGEINETQMHYVKTMQAALDRLTTLVNNTIDISKIESGKMQVDCAPVSPYDVESYIQAQFEPIMIRRSITFVCTSEAMLPEINADYSLLVQILSNLLSNAAKFTPAGGEVSLRIHMTEGDVHSVTFDVQDTGVGIPPENMVEGMLFSKFYQVRAKDRGIGSGLGLAISKNLVNLMQGEIHVESAVGEGTCFTVQIPVVPSVAIG